MKILYFCPFSKGGLADYSRYQGKALAALEDTIVLWLAPEACPAPEGAQCLKALTPALQGANGKPRSKVKRAWDFYRSTLSEIKQLDEAIRISKPDAVLFASYAEYFSPLWAWRLRRWRKRGIKFASVVHDPVRNYQRGPKFWHQWSIAEAYSFLDVAFVHQYIHLDTARPMPDLRIEVIPLGLYEFETVVPAKAMARAKLGIPQDAPVFLSFGHIRDGKNLDQFIEIMPEFPEIHLIVAGMEQSSGQKPAGYYQNLAVKARVDSRTHWNVRHIPESETGLFFAAADYLLLTYSADFRSASAVLAAVAQFEIPVLASAGEGPMKSAVEDYRLGYFGKPSDILSLKAGIRQILASLPKPHWENFRLDHSWETNASKVRKSLEDLSGEARNPV